MKVIQVNGAYKEGSTGQIVYNIHNFLMKHGHESIVCYGRGMYFNDEHVYKISSEFGAKLNVLWGRIFGIQYGGCILSTNKLIRIIKRENPDVVHLHCINGSTVNIYRIIRWLKKNRIKTVVTLHAEFFYTGSCEHAFDCEKWLTGCGNCPQLWKATKSYFFDTTHLAWIKMNKAFSGFYKNLIVVSVSSWLSERAIKSPILRDKQHYVVENGIDTGEIFHYIVAEEMKKKLKLTNEKVILHVTANFTSNVDSLKGGWYILELAKRLLDKNIKVIVIGSRDPDLKHPENIINIGRVENQKELAAYYSMADLCVIASKRETYSLVCAESLSCGTPVVGFKAGGPETISLNEYSEFVEYGDIDSFEKVVLKWIDVKSTGISKSLAVRAGKTYSKEKMDFEYLKLYTSLCNNSKEY